jgi:hypothetical protein
MARPVSRLLPHQRPVVQRWRDGRSTWRRRRDGGFDPGRYQLTHVDGGDARAVRAFVLAHHYAPTLPAGRLYYAMTDAATGQLVGAVILGIPTHPAVLTSPFPQLEPYTESKPPLSCSVAAPA